MQYIYDGEFYKIVKITGPKHNMLSLSFGEKQASIEVSDLDKSANETLSISACSVENQVRIGIKEINNELNTNYNVLKIQFISSDSPSDSIYIELTKKIVKRLKSGGEFIRL